MSLRQWVARYSTCVRPVLQYDSTGVRVWRNGRRAWFRSMWGQPREGSTPFTRTIVTRRGPNYIGAASHRHKRAQRAPQGNEWRQGKMPRGGPMGT